MIIFFPCKICLCVLKLNLFISIWLDQIKQSNFKKNNNLTCKTSRGGSSFAIFKDSNPAPTQVQILLGTMISIAQNYEKNVTAIQIAGRWVTYGYFQYRTKRALSDTPKWFEYFNNFNVAMALDRWCCGCGIFQVLQLFGRKRQEFMVFYRN